MKGRVNMAIDSVGVVAQPKQTGGAGKAVASTFIPGLGQLCDGRNKAGLGYMGANVALGVGGYALANSISKDCFRAMKASMANPGTFDVSKYLKNIPKGKMYGAIALGLAGTALWIANIVDAYKGDKNKA